MYWQTVKPSTTSYKAIQRAEGERELALAHKFNWLWFTLQKPCVFILEREWNSRSDVYRGDFRKPVKACEFTHVEQSFLIVIPKIREEKNINKDEGDGGRHEIVKGLASIIHIIHNIVFLQTRRADSHFAASCILCRFPTERKPVHSALWFMPATSSRLAATLESVYRKSAAG